MPRHHERRFLPYTAAQMFDLVADVGRYAEFLPWVVGVRVKSDSETEIVADLLVGFKGLRETFTSRVKKSRAGAITVDYIDGPLKNLHNAWAFEDAPGGCMVTFDVDFSFRNRVFEALAGQMFGTALRQMTTAFETRAAALYGSNSSSAHNAA